MTVDPKVEVLLLRELRGVEDRIGAKLDEVRTEMVARFDSSDRRFREGSDRMQKMERTIDALNCQNPSKSCALTPKEEPVTANFSRKIRLGFLGGLAIGAGIVGAAVGFVAYLVLKGAA